MTGENIRQNVREEAHRGEECIRAAGHLLAGGFHSDAISRAYYAAFHFARALLLSRELEPKSHRGVIQLIGLHFAKDGPLSEEVAGILSQLEIYRELSDYNSAAVFSDEQARRTIERANQFIDACKVILRQLDYL
jgi:uncharacterized protein (UPF0332 family)